MVSEWRSVIAASLNVGGGVRLIKPAKLYMCTQTHYKHNESGRTAPAVCDHGSVPLSRYEDWITHIHTHACFIIGNSHTQRQQLEVFQENVLRAPLL